MTARDAPPPLDELLARREWVRRFARTLAKDDASADDLAQDAWVVAVERPPRHADAPAGWFRRVLVRRAMDVARGTRRRERRELDSFRADVAPSTVDVVAAAESHRRVVEAVLALDEPYRTTVLLRFFEDLPPREVAARMGVPAETVRSRVRRAVESLRARLDEKHDGRRAAWLAPLLVDGRGAPAPTTIGLAAKGAIAMTATKKAAAVLVALLVLGAGATALFRRSGDSGKSAAAGAASVDVAAAATKERTRRHVDASTEDAAPTSAVAPSSAPSAVATSTAGGRDFVVVAVDETGRFVEGVRIGVHATGGAVKRDTGSDFSITRTDASGRAVFRIAGDVDTAWAEATDRSEYLYRGDKVRVAPGAAEVRVVVERRTWISGSVVGEDGRPLPKRHVVVLGRGRQVGLAFADDGGRFRIDVAPDGVWDVVLTGLTSETASVLPKPTAAVDDVPDLVGDAPGVPSGAERLVIVARPVTGRRDLRIRTETSDGAPLAGVNVLVILPTSRVPFGDGRTDADGRFDCSDVPDRRVIVCVSSKQGEIPAWESAGWIKPASVFVRPGGDVTLVFQRGRAIRGRVEYPADAARPLGADGKPLRTIVVVQRPGELDLVSQTWCDDEGRFTAWAPVDAAGPFRISACGWMTRDGRVIMGLTEDAAAGAENVVLKFVETKQ